MALEQLIDRIQNDTEKEVASVLDAAEKEARAIETSAKEREESLLARELERHRVQLEFEAKHRISALESTQKRAFLDERENLLNEIRGGMEERLVAMPPAEEKGLLESLLAKASRIIPDGSVSLTPTAKELLAARLGAYEIDTDESLIGGFVLTSADGRRVLDCTYANLVQHFWDEQRISVARALLGDEMYSEKAES